MCSLYRFRRIIGSVRMRRKRRKKGRRATMRKRKAKRRGITRRGKRVTKTRRMDLLLVLSCHNCLVRNPL